MKINLKYQIAMNSVMNIFSISSPNGIEKTKMIVKKAP
jgi:hypothetical protein